MARLTIPANQYPPKSREYAPEGTVVLYQFQRLDRFPSISPFCVKLETYLRMAKVPYKNDFNNILSSKGKTPWVSLDGVDVADTQFSIQYINKKLGVDLNKHLDKHEKAVAVAFRRMIEEGCYWVMMHQRWVRDGAAFDFVDKNGYGYFRPIMQGHSQGQGTGRHSNDEADQMADTDFYALSNFLGEKTFLMGQQPSEEDATLFAFLAFAKHNLPGSKCQALVHELRNLSEYVERMKELYWPDWNDFKGPKME